MTQISKRLEQIVSKELSKRIIPVKTDKGILVGNVLIENQGSIKNLWQKDEIVYANVFLNKVAIKLANMLALQKRSINSDQLYQADQEYGKWFLDSQMLRNRYQQALNSQQYDKADIYWARYSESRDKTANAKVLAERLANF